MLENYIASVSELYRDDLVVIVDVNMEVLFAGTECFKLATMPINQIIGSNVFDAVAIQNKNQSIAKDAFEAAMSQKQSKQFLSINIYRVNPDYRALLINLQPILDPNTKQVIGAQIKLIPAELLVFFPIILRQNTQQTINDLPDNDHFLTRGEHQIAFLLFHTRNYAEIAEIITKLEGKPIKVSTINNIVHRYLFTKFNANTREMLIVELEKHNYHRKIPNSLLINQFIDMTKAD